MTPARANVTHHNPPNLMFYPMDGNASDLLSDHDAFRDTRAPCSRHGRATSTLPFTGTIQSSRRRYSVNITVTGIIKPPPVCIPFGRVIRFFSVLSFLSYERCCLPWFCVRQLLSAVEHGSDKLSKYACCRSSGGLTRCLSWSFMVGRKGVYFRMCAPPSDMDGRRALLDYRFYRQYCTHHSGTYR